MTFQRQRLSFVLAAAAAAVVLTAAPAMAQGAYPSKSVLLIVPTAAGGTTDLSGRMAAQALAPVLGQSVVVDNKGGGNGAIAANLVKRADADGYTLLMQYSGYHVISPHLVKAKSWEQGDFVPVANVLSAPQIIVVRADLPVKTLAELVSYAKADPGKLNYASSGNGSLQHVTGAMLEQQAGAKMVHVPYKGTGPALQDLLGGQVDLTFGTAPPFMPHVQSGKLRV
ncbi:MAG: tripartite tricarboxylate transporter substrate binding protein, partial [Comamonas sp.]